MFVSDTNAIFLRSLLYRIIIALFCSLIHAKTYDLVIIGDSISSGYGVDYEKSWVPLWSKDLPCIKSIRNMSVQGATTQDGIDNLAYFYQDNQADWALIALGGNDALRGLPIQDISARLTTMIKIAKTNRSKTLLMATDLPPNYGPAYRAAYQKVFQRVAKKHRVPLLYLPFPESDGYIQADGIHPNEAGHQLIAQSAQQLTDYICNK